MARLLPTKKSAAITDFLEKTTGRSTAIKSLKCVRPPLGCGKEIPPGEFETYSPMTITEYRMSGLCETCQDEVFRDPEDDGPDDDEELRDLY